MNDLVVIVPSRGRPGNVVALLDAWDATDANAWLRVDLDDDDPTTDTLQAQVLGRDAPHAVFARGERVGLCGSLNRAAVAYAPSHRYVGFMGDDHRPRTPGWDDAVCDALDQLGTGIVYGNDLVQGEALPTAVFMTADIVRALGYMAPPVLQHLYLDNTWLSWGRAIDRLRYLPDVIIEHCHPIAATAAEDQTYREAWARGAGDVDAFTAYIAHGFDADVAKLQALL